MAQKGKHKYMTPYQEFAAGVKAAEDRSLRMEQTGSPDLYEANKWKKLTQNTDFNFLTRVKALAAWNRQLDLLEEGQNTQSVTG